jgi:hypothetical protein
MLYSEIITVCSQIHTKLTNVLCGQNVELLTVEPGGTYSDHWTYTVNGTDSNSANALSDEDQPRYEAKELRMGSITNASYWRKQQKQHLSIRYACGESACNATANGPTETWGVTRTNDKFHWLPWGWNRVSAVRSEGLPIWTAVWHT